jgi:hypothetical protein
VLHQARTGSYVYHMVMFSIVCTLLIYGASAFVLNQLHFPFVRPLDAAALGIASCIVVALVVAYLSRNRTWGDIVLEHLIAYQPVNTNAYRDLQEKLKEGTHDFGGLLNEFILFEKDSLFVQKPEKETKFEIFMQKQV